MENDYSSFLQKGEDGSVQSFDESKLQSYIDSMVGQGVTAFKNKFEKEQQKASMTEQQKFDAAKAEFEEQKNQFNEYMKAQKTELVLAKAKVKLASANFSEKEIEILSKSINDDEKSSLEMIDALVAERQKSREDERKKLIEEIQSNQPRTGSQANAGNEKSQTEVKKRTSKDILNLYK